jgi:GNAT superfamily N-acetyltransferase
MLGVAGRARGLGIGTALTERCIERTRELGLARLVMSSANYMTTAHRIYERLGFVRLHPATGPRSRASTCTRSPWTCDCHADSW